MTTIFSLKVKLCCDAGSNYCRISYDMLRIVFLTCKSYMRLHKANCSSIVPNQVTFSFTYVVFGLMESRNGFIPVK